MNLNFDVVISSCRTVEDHAEPNCSTTTHEELQIICCTVQQTQFEARQLWLTVAAEEGEDITQRRRRWVDKVIDNLGWD